MNEWMDKEDAHSVCMCVCVFDCNIFQRTCSLQVQEIAVRLTLLPHTVNRKYHYLANKGSLVMITYALLPTPSCGIHKRKGKEADQETPDAVAWMQR